MKISDRLQLLSQAMRAQEAQWQNEHDQNLALQRRFPDPGRKEDIRLLASVLWNAHMKRRIALYQLAVYGPLTALLGLLNWAAVVWLRLPAYSYAPTVVAAPFVLRFTYRYRSFTADEQTTEESLRAFRELTEHDANSGANP